MLRLGRKKIVAILTGIFLALETAGAVAASASAPHTPWYSAWYLWIGLAIFVIALVSVLGTNTERE